MLKAIAPIITLSVSSIILFNPAHLSAQNKTLNFNNYQQDSLLIAQTTLLRFKLPDRGVPKERIGAATRVIEPIDDGTVIESGIESLYRIPANIFPTGTGSDSSINQSPTIFNRNAGDRKPTPVLLDTNKVVSAIVPPENMALTINQSPTIFVYVTENNAVDATIKVVNEDGKELYQSQFTPPNQAGILRVKLPANINIEEKKLYKWEIELISEDNTLSNTLALKTSGWLEKVSLPEDTAQEMKEGEIWDNLNVLAQAGIWYDTLEKLALLRLENPDDTDIKREWVELLNSVGLKSIGEVNILPEVVEIR